MLKTLNAAAAAVALAAALSAPGASAQVIEDHSLPRSAVKTYHVKCPNGRLAMVRYDTRQEPARVCASVQDGSRAQQCARIAQEQIGQKLSGIAQAACR